MAKKETKKTDEQPQAKAATQAKSDPKRRKIAASGLSDPQKNVALALTYFVSVEVAIEMARHGVTAQTLKDKGLDELTLRYGLGANEAAEVQKKAQKGLPEGIEAELTFIPVPETEEQEEKYEENP